MRWSRNPVAASQRSCRNRQSRLSWSTASVLAMLLIAVVCGAMSATGLQALAQEHVSPATGHAQVVAHGVVPVPGAEIAWRVSSRDASADGIAEAGFLVADRGVVLIINQTTDEAFRLAPGMALLTHGGERQERTSLGAGAGRYYAIELVLADDVVTNADAGPSYTSDPFPGSNAHHAISLVRDVLADGELTELPPGMAPTLVLATAGTVDVATAPGQTPVRLAAGQAVVMGGTLSVAANAGPAAFVAAMIGPEVTLPSPQPTPATADPGSVEVVARECPAGYPGGAGEIPDQFAVDCREPLPGISFTLAGAGRETTARTDANGRFRVDGVAPGDYLLTNEIPGENRRFQVYCVNATLGGQATTARNQFEILMTAGARVRCEWYVIPASDASAGTGVISLQGLAPGQGIVRRLKFSSSAAGSAQRRAGKRLPGAATAR